MNSEFHPEDPRRFEAAIRRFDEENARDPNTEIVNGVPRQRELMYAQWLTDWVLKLSPNASEELRLAARCQHICRWTIARGSYPMSRAGYLKWRADLKIFHAEKAGEILQAAGYPDEAIAKVRALVLKKNFPHDPECRVLEDALCLIFLERQLTPLVRKSTEDKVINALQKSWAKMTEAARAEALKLNYTDEEMALIKRALAEV